jgi:phenylpyruvate tautomerase PptA (4-oxalocrotonate tautomerase family)
MPFIDSKVSVKVTKEQETELKSRLGQAISLIPGKSESWLMVGIEDEYHLYFRGEDSEPMAFIEVRIFGGPNRDAFEKMTAEITKIYGDVLGIAADHMYIKYSATTDWGWNGSNF